MIIGSYHFSCVVAPLLYYIKLPVTIKLLDSIVWILYFIQWDIR